MPLPVYSTPFINVAGNPSVSRAYVVPAGFVAVIRDFDAFVGAFTGNGYAQIQDVTSGAIVFAGVIPNTQHVLQWRGRQVFEPGTQFLASANADAGTPQCSVRLSGYLLSLP